MNGREIRNRKRKDREEETRGNSSERETGRLLLLFSPSLKVTLRLMIPTSRNEEFAGSASLGVVKRGRCSLPSPRTGEQTNQSVSLNTRAGEGQHFSSNSLARGTTKAELRVAFCFPTVPILDRLQCPMLTPNGLQTPLLNFAWV